MAAYSGATPYSEQANAEDCVATLYGPIVLRRLLILAQARTSVEVTTEGNYNVCTC